MSGVDYRIPLAAVRQAEEIRSLPETPERNDDDREAA